MCMCRYPLRATHDSHSTPGANHNRRLRHCLHVLFSGEMVREKSGTLFDRDPRLLSLLHAELSRLEDLEKKRVELRVSDSCVIYGFAA
jgi:hypothetical protein